MALYYPNYKAFERGLQEQVDNLSYEDAAKVYNLAAELNGEQQLHVIYVDGEGAFVGNEEAL